MKRLALIALLALAACDGKTYDYDDTSGRGIKIEVMPTESDNINYDVSILDLSETVQEPEPITAFPQETTETVDLDDEVTRYGLERMPQPSANDLYHQGYAWAKNNATSFGDCRSTSLTWLQGCIDYLSNQE